jgi:hypothetical protein
MAIKKNAVAHAAEVLVNAQTKAQPADDAWIPGTEGFTVGKYALAKDPEIVKTVGLAMKATDTATSIWTVLSDILHGKGIRASMLAGKDVVDEVRDEVLDLVTVARFGNYIAAETAEGVKIGAVADIKASHDRKSLHWKLMSAERRDLAMSRDKQVGTYMDRLLEQLRKLDGTAKKKGKTAKTVEEQYLDLLGPVLLFLQGIDQVKVDPKFDWAEEFGAVSAAVNRAKRAKGLSIGQG